MERLLCIVLLLWVHLLGRSGICRADTAAPSISRAQPKPARTLQQVGLVNGNVGNGSSFELKRLQQLEKRIKQKNDQKAQEHYAQEQERIRQDSKKSLVVISFGAESRPWFLSVQMSTFAFHPFVEAFEAFTESHFDPCIAPNNCPQFPSDVCAGKRRCREAASLNPAASRPVSFNLHP